MDSVLPQYELDTSGYNPNNRVSNEKYALNPGVYRPLAINAGAYFVDSLAVVDAVTGIPLVLEKQYVAILNHREAEELTGAAVASAVLIIDPSVSSRVNVSYQAVGGDYQQIADTVKGLLDALDISVPHPTYGDVRDAPTEFTPAPHKQDVKSLYGTDELVQVLTEIGHAIAEGGSKECQSVRESLEKLIKLGSLEDLIELAHSIPSLGLIASMVEHTQELSGAITHEEDTGAVDTLHTRQVIASRRSRASADATQVSASHDSIASAPLAQVHGSRMSIAEGRGAQVHGSNESVASAERSQVLASTKIKNQTAHSTAWGYGTHGSPSEANQTVRVESVSGIVRTANGMSSNGMGYAHVFENVVPGIIPDGTIVTQQDGKVRASSGGDRILGVVTPSAAVIGNAADLCWHDRYLTDEFGRVITKAVDFMDIPEVTKPVKMVQFNGFKGTVAQCKDEIPANAYYWTENVSLRAGYRGLVSEYDGKIPSEAIRWQEEVPVENPDYNHRFGYQSRLQRREEHSVVALMGPVLVRIVEEVESGDFLDGSGRKSSSETRLETISVKKQYDSSKGYGVVLALLR